MATCNNLARQICSEAGHICGWCEWGMAMEICEKCGRPVNYRLNGICIACRYEEKKKENGRGQEKALHRLRPSICTECGAEYIPRRSNEIRCGQCISEESNVSKATKTKTSGRDIGICAECGRPFHAGYSPMAAKCPDCLKAERVFPAPPPHVDSPTRTMLARPGGWTGPIAREKPDKPAKAKIKIPASRLPAPPFPPTKPLRINLEPPQTAYEYEVTPEAREARKSKKIVPVISRRKQP